MRMVYGAVAGLLLLSCTGTGIDRERFCEGDGQRYQETAMEDYEAVRRLEENPLDLKRATREMLLSIPGFPPRLAKRVIWARDEHRSGTQWFKLLTPAERETLYRFERFLVLPERGPTRIRARIGRNRIGVEGSERTDAFLSVENEMWRLRLRGRGNEQGRALSPYISRMVFSSSLNLCFGDFTPDFAMGLLFNGSPYYYPFSSGFPLRGRRWIVPAPSLYFEALRGCAIEAWRGCLRGMFFGGRPRTYTGRTVEVDSRCVWGGRVRAMVGRGEAGITLRRNEPDGADPLCALDCRWRRGNVRTAVEMVAAGRGAGAGTWGLSLQGYPVDVGVVTYQVPFGFGSRFAAVPGGAIRVSSWQRGCAAVVSGAVRRRSVIRTSYERYVSGDAADRRQTEIIRTEFEARWKPVTLRFSYRWRFQRDDPGIPYPADEPVSSSGSGGGHILFIGRRGAAAQVRVSARFTDEERGRGYLVSSSTRFELLRRHVRCTVAGCLYRAVSGAPILYTYEPVLEGSYPWVSVRGSGWRGIMLIEMRWGGLAVSGRAVTGTTLDAEMGLTLSFRR